LKGNELVGISSGLELDRQSFSSTEVGSQNNQLSLSSVTIFTVNDLK
jgi:hypothetical protein